VRDYNHAQLIGQIFGTLEVIGIGQTNKFRKKQFIVQCTEHSNIPPYEVTKQSLINGSSTGCPECWKEKHQTHGKTGTKIYNAYKGIIGRVLDPTHKDYSNYGGRGIDIDPRYNPSFQDQGLQVAFENFFGDLGDIPIGLTIDRKDNSRGYWKDNIRFATMEEQHRNRRNNVVNETIVKQIRSDWLGGQYSSYAELARKHNLHHTEIIRIINNEIWKNV